MDAALTVVACVVGLPVMILTGWGIPHLIVGIPFVSGPSVLPQQDEKIFFADRWMTTQLFLYFYWHYDVFVTNRRVIVNVSGVGNVINATNANVKMRSWRRGFGKTIIGAMQGDKRRTINVVDHFGTPCRLACAGERAGVRVEYV